MFQELSIFSIIYNRLEIFWALQCIILLLARTRNAWENKFNINLYTRVVRYIDIAWTWVNYIAS